MQKYSNRIRVAIIVDSSRESGINCIIFYIGNIVYSREGAVVVNDTGIIVIEGVIFYLSAGIVAINRYGANVPEGVAVDLIVAEGVAGRTLGIDSIDGISDYAMLLRMSLSFDFSVIPTQSLS